MFPAFLPMSRVLLEGKGEQTYFLWTAGSKGQNQGQWGESWGGQKQLKLGVIFLTEAEH